jgi:DNA topoisomerase-1
MAKPLVIVESPAKAKTIGQFLGSDYKVMASVGHVVDLPSSGLCVDVENDFKLTYEVTKKDVVRDLKDALKGASELYLATDEDREGEAIAWHLQEQLKPKVPTRRMVFHEITKKAIQAAVSNSREINMGLVDAQETRRTLDRLYGYEVSPVLWRKVKTGLSAGRVQSPTIRLIVERERERMRFHTVTYWDLSAQHTTTPGFESGLFTVGGQRVASGKDFDENGKLENANAVWADEARAKALQAGLEGQTFTVKSLETRPYRSTPKAPFMTSTLQQEGGRKLNMSAQQVMRLAQGLYEGGYITYMRTDSTNLSETAITAARAQITQLFGERYLSPEPRQYNRKVKNAQEAHEAIRPAGEAFRTPDELATELNASQLKLYDLIWKRTLACQMADSEGESLSVKISASTKAGEAVEFSASGRTISFHGFLKAYVESSDEATSDDQETALPPLKEGQVLPVSLLEAKGHVTSPPARYTEASLVKKLEELGIGRPSTYASIMGTLQAKYVWKKGQALIPNWEAFAVVALMEKHFVDLVDLEFTAELEKDLDTIASGEREKVNFLKEFYFGDKKHRGLKKQVTQNIEDIDAAAINSIHIGEDPNGVEIVVKPGRFGPYIKRGEDTVGLPETLPPDEVTVEKAMAMFAAPKGDVPIGVDEATKLNVYVKQGRFGPYVQLGEVTDDSKPKTASLFKTMKPEEVTLPVALQLLTLPRLVGVTAEGEEITASNGRFGPYVTKAKPGAKNNEKDSRNLGVEAEAKLLTLTMEEALEIFKQPKQFRGRGAPKPPLASWPNPAGGPDIVLKEGRFGLYVTDGETNASLRKGDEPGDLNAERVVELLVQRREYMASPEGQERAARRGAKKAKKAKAPKAKAAKAVAVPEAEKPAKKASPAKKAAAPKKDKVKAEPAPKKKPAAKKKAGDKKSRSAP